MKAPPIVNRYHDIRLSRGKATSGAPIIIGRTKLPSVVGIDGTRKNHTMTMPCSVNRPIILIVGQKQAVGLQQFQPHQADRDAAR